ncbi:hypothetical protein KKH27_00060 [bacterium]|nr:hypothetical protein [bacterium]MBU1984155.1 hypothetical protein [bacterium]
MDLDTLKKYTRGELSPKQFLAVHQEADELMELLQAHLHPGEHLTSLAEWPILPTRRQTRHYAMLKNMMLATPFVLVGGAAFMFASPYAMLITGLILFAVFAMAAVALAVRQARARKSRAGRSVLAVTNRRILRIWLDGTGEVQSWMVTDAERSRQPVEPVPETVRLLLQLDLGETSLN